MLSNLLILFTGDWWKQTYGTLFRTAVAGLSPFLLAYSKGMPVDWKVVGSQVGLLLILAALTSLKGIPTLVTATYWEVLGGRFLRQFAQFLIAGIGTATLFTEVPWWAVLVGAATSALSTILIGSLILIPGTPPEVPEVELDPVQENDPAVVFTEDEPSEAEEAEATDAELALVGDRFA